jgi:hypothetical protein
MTAARSALAGAAEAQGKSSKFQSPCNIISNVTIIKRVCDVIVADECCPKIARRNEYLIGRYFLAAIYEVDRPACLSRDNSLNGEVGMFFNAPMFGRRGGLSAKVQRSALFSDMILKIAKLHEPQFLTLLLGEIVKHPIAEMPSRHRSVEGAILQLIDKLQQDVRFKHLIITGDLAISINFPVQFFYQVQAAFVCKRLIATRERHVANFSVKTDERWG